MAGAFYVDRRSARIPLPGCVIVGRHQLAWVVIGLFRIGQILATVEDGHTCGGLSSRFNLQDVPPRYCQAEDCFPPNRR
ncbi:hypothetical protein IE4872_PD01538 (plasmid) [Rhizobium gallicum]|uniref:Uncharacterized protein n=1 Tax=Rhizobium gallicum TaxID=56730 RepID=A0A1L5NW27_9HYPH|nr:hypothetical protein IE4872_PD01538 [Rhizobium gallicum]